MSFANHEWVVTPAGINTTGGLPPYAISAKSLIKSSQKGDKRFYDWPLDMARENWLDIDTFVEVFEEALIIHSDKFTFDRDMLRRSCREALRIAGERAAWATPRILAQPARPARSAEIAEGSNAWRRKAAG